MRLKTRSYQISKIITRKYLTKGTTHDIIKISSTPHISKFDHDYGQGKWGCKERKTWKP